MPTKVAKERGRGSSRTREMGRTRVATLAFLRQRLLLLERVEETGPHHVSAIITVFPIPVPLFQKWIPAESYQRSVDYGTEVVEEKSISRPCTRKRRQRWLKWKWQQQERSKVVASSFPLAKAFERIMGCVTVKDASMLALLSVHRLSCFVYKHELREVVPPPDDTPWPILWLMAAFHPKHTFCGKAPRFGFGEEVHGCF